MKCIQTGQDNKHLCYQYQTASNSIGTYILEYLGWVEHVIELNPDTTISSSYTAGVPPNTIHKSITKTWWTPRQIEHQDVLNTSFQWTLLAGVQHRHVTLPPRLNSMNA